MQEKRKEEITKEIQRRLSEWLKYSTFEEFTVQGSFMRFEMAIGLNGYPFAKEEWMKNKKFNKFITDKEFYSDEYNKIINNIFQLNLNK
jgi:hypothetical protein